MASSREPSGSEQVRDPSPRPPPFAEIADGAGSRHPKPVRSAAATRSAVGKTADSPAHLVAVGMRPETARRASSTSRPISRRAPLTVICCPSIARTASSKPSHAPGTRKPGRAATSGAEHRVYGEVGRDQRQRPRRGRTRGGCADDRRQRIRGPGTGSSPSGRRLPRAGLTSIVPCRPAKLDRSPVAIRPRRPRLRGSPGPPGSR